MAGDEAGNSNMMWCVLLQDRMLELLGVPRTGVSPTKVGQTVARDGFLERTNS